MSTASVNDNIGQSAMRKALWRIIPLIGLAYLCAYVDRVNVSFAAATMNADLGFSATVYGLGAGLFFLGYALFEIPSNLMLVRYGARKWLARIMITWGLLSAAMMFVETPLQFYALRFLLGVAEAGFYPGVIFYFSSWFPPCHRSRAVSRFFIASPIASIVMGGMAGWMLALDGNGGLHGWQWMFLLQGLPTVLFGLLLLRYLPDRPATADWLTQAERDWIAGELAREQARIGEPASHNVLAACRNPNVLLLGLFGFLLIAVITTMVLNAPLVLAAATTLDAAQIGYVVGIGGALGVVAILVAGNYADRIGDRWILSAAFCGALCAAMLLMGLATTPMLVLVGYLVFATACFVVPSLSSSGWSEAMPARELAVGAAAINTMSQMGAFVAPYGWGMAKDATGSFQSGLLALALVALLAVGVMLHLRRQIRGSAQRPAAI